MGSLVPEEAGKAGLKRENKEYNRENEVNGMKPESKRGREVRICLVPRISRT